jgi:hypothetical protein
MHRIVSVLLFGLFLSLPAGAQIVLQEGCVAGDSQLTHGIAPAAAEERIKNYARLYTRDYSAFKDMERKARRKAYKFMEIKEWTQADVLGFTFDQRELLYISVGGELGLGRIDVTDLPGYVQSIERKIYDLEIEMGCARQ